MTNTSEWQRLVKEALLESDPPKLRRLVDASQFAIVERLRELKDTDNSAVEREDLHEGIRILRRLQVERLHYPARPAVSPPKSL